MPFFTPMDRSFRRNITRSPGGERALPALGLDHLVLAQCAGVTHPRTGELVQLGHVGPGMGEHDLASLRPGLAHGVPAVHEGAASGLAGLVRGRPCRRGLVAV